MPINFVLPDNKKHFLCNEVLWWLHERIHPLQDRNPITTFFQNLYSVFYSIHYLTKTKQIISQVTPLQYTIGTLIIAADRKEFLNGCSCGRLCISWWQKTYFFSINNPFLFLSGCWNIFTRFCGPDKRLFDALWTCRVLARDPFVRPDYRK